MERTLARFLIVSGVIMALAGVAILAAPRIPFLGKLPGDIRWTRGSTSIYFPLATCLVLSLLVTALLNLLQRR